MAALRSPGSVSATRGTTFSTAVLPPMNMSAFWTASRTPLLTSLSSTTSLSTAPAPPESPSMVAAVRLSDESPDAIRASMTE
ncbi:MAG: hypothetical protein BWX71_02158 [Deltaproteobacteria bacterium ADurb.Bin072]|nr:MAG: hypothetical protein BWX71_02158 [Deltaproteobacteria bacterium ADurb.Bin072]